MSDFTRINAPRVAKIEARLSVIRKSARSQNIGNDEIAALLAPVVDMVTLALSAPPPLPREPIVGYGTAAAPIKPPATLREAPHIHQIAGFVAALPSEQLPSYITHLVNRLCEQAEQAKAA